MIHRSRSRTACWGWESETPLQNSFYFRIHLFIFFFLCLHKSLLIPHTALLQPWLTVPFSSRLPRSVHTHTSEHTPLMHPHKGNKIWPNRECVTTVLSASLIKHRQKTKGPPSRNSAADVFIMCFDILSVAFFHRSCLDRLIGHDWFSQPLGYTLTFIHTHTHTPSGLVH